MHTSTDPGKRVRIKLKNGGSVEGKFVERKSKYVMLDSGKVFVSDIKQFIVVKVADGC